MPSLSTLHRCGRSTDEMLIVARRGPSRAFLPLQESGRSSDGEQTSGSGQAQAESEQEGEREASKINKSEMELGRKKRKLRLAPLFAPTGSGPQV